jgi:CheY-like chemotaxis protein
MHWLREASCPETSELEFVVRIPATIDDVESAPHESSRERSADHRLNVLVVDDQPDTADSVALLVESLGHQARAVYDGRTGLAVAHGERPDVMFVDIGMPGMTGYELARRVRSDAALAHIRLVALTGYGRAEDRARVIEAGFDVHLTKPVTDARLEAILSEHPASGAGRT